MWQAKTAMPKSDLPCSCHLPPPQAAARMVSEASSAAEWAAFAVRGYPKESPLPLALPGTGAVAGRNDGEK